MKFIVRFDLSRQKAVEILAVSLNADAEIKSKKRLLQAIETHISIFGEAVWPELRGFTPPEARRKKLLKQADALLTKYCPKFI